MRILIVEDDEFTTRVLTDILASQNYAIETAKDGRAGWELVKTFAYDLILLDVVLPGLDGITFCRQLRSENYQLPVLLLTGRDGGHDKAIGLDAGADDYVVKPFDPEELVARIRALLRRSNQTAMPILEWGDLRLDPSTCEAFFQERPMPLTPKEYALLELFLRNSHRVFSCGMILEHLWSFQETPGEEAVRTHIKGLRQKLKAAGASSDLIENVYGIGYRLKPLKIKPEETPAKGETPAPATDSLKQQTLAAIAGVWDRFKERFYSQVEVLESAAKALQQQALTPELRQQAEQEAHTLAGSLGTFGFPKGSKLARQIEHLLRDLPALEPGDSRRLQQWVGALRQEIEPTATLAVAVDLPASTDERPWLLIVDCDRTFTEQLTQEAENWGLRTTVTPTLQGAREILAQQRPDAVLLDLATPLEPSSPTTSDRAGLALLTELTHRIPPIPVLTVTDQDRLVDRLEVAREGGRAFLHKPIAPSQVMDSVIQTVKRVDPRAARVMAIDDDPRILAMLRALLEPWGLKVTTLQDPRRFWDVLEATHPDLLIMDVKMPHISGIELCQVVRNDPHWSGLPILFLTAHTDAEVINQVFAVSADDFITKPIAGPELVARILNRVERIQLLRRLADTDPLTGVFNRHKSTQLLQDLIERAQQQQQPFCFAVLTLDRLREINKTYGHATGDAVLHRLGELLQRSFRGEDLVARWGGEEFIVGMYGMTRRDGVERLLQVLQVLHQEEFSHPEAQNGQAATGQRFQVTFSAGVAEFPEDGRDLQSLYRSADAALSEARAPHLNGTPLKQRVLPVTLKTASLSLKPF